MGQQRQAAIMNFECIYDDDTNDDDATCEQFRPFQYRRHSILFYISMCIMHTKINSPIYNSNNSDGSKKEKSQVKREYCTYIYICKYRYILYIISVWASYIDAAAQTTTYILFNCFVLSITIYLCYALEFAFILHHTYLFIITWPLDE